MTQECFRIQRPPLLRPGDTVGVVATAGKVDPQGLETGLRVLGSMGFRTRVAPEVFGERATMAGTDIERARALNRMFADDDIQAVFCARGGYGTLRILPLLDWAALAKKPKPVLGFSDVSALLWAIHRRLGLVVFHGPMVCTLHQTDAEGLERLREAICSEAPITLVARDGRVLRQGRAQGLVVCGNLTTLCHLVGTTDAPVFRDRILVLEDRGEAPYRIDRMLTQMRQAGCFEGLRGLALGDFSDCGPADAVYGVFLDVFAGMDIPILAGFPVGHGPANHTVPVGMAAVLDTAEGSLGFLQSAVSVCTRPKKNETAKPPQNPGGVPDA